jgi:CheY-like chemotaxis protein/anti-sigma regulatory factor (Ser/Thr protein kinase)
LNIESTNESVRSDARLLRRIVQNLVANAIKYTPGGGTVTLSARPEGAFMNLTIADNGVGIPKERQAEIWEEFKQLKNPERDARKGLGLGMAIVKRMAALLEHPLSLESEEGAGTSVTVRVPRALSPLQGVARKETDSFRGALLLIEDDEAIAASTAALLKEWGLQVDTCSTAEAALDAFAHADTHYDAVLADYRLPGLSGADAVRAARLKSPGVLGLIVTGEVMSTELEALRASGVRVLKKPLHPDRLAEAMAPLRSTTADHQALAANARS